MDCYSSVQKSGNFLFVRAQKNQQRIKYKVKYTPTLYTPSKVEEKTAFQSLDGTFLSPVELGTMYDAKDFVERYRDVSGFSIFGNTEYQYSYIAEEWKNDSSLVFSDLSILNIDIETETILGFPDPETTPESINAITVQDMNTKKFFAFGLKAFENHRKDVIYVQCIDEADLLRRFVFLWEKFDPDIITGWNISFFDIPYLYNRISKILSEDFAKKLTPWNRIQESKVEMFGRKQLKYKIPGLAILDYLDLYRKFSYKNLESYRLDYVAFEELGEHKLDHSEYDSFQSFYENDPQKFIEYNIRDVEIISRFEDKLKLIELAIYLAYKTRCNYEDIFSPVRVWDIYIFNYLLQRNIIVPLRKHSVKSIQYEGAFVFEPAIGMHKWITSFDLNSLYPNIIRLCNISPDVILNQSKTLKLNDLIEKKYDFDDIHEKDIVISANGLMAQKNKRGFLSDMLGEMYEERVAIKKEMIECKNSLEKMKQ